MTLNDFEQLVNHWLDAPHDAALAAQVANACAANPEFAKRHREYERLMKLVEQATTPPQSLTARLRRADARRAAEPAPEALDAVLRDVTAPPTALTSADLRSRVNVALAAPAPLPQPPTLRIPTVIIAATGIAAAWLLVMMLNAPGGAPVRPPAETGFAAARVVSIVNTDRSAQRLPAPRAYVQITQLESASAAPAPADPPAVASVNDGELLLMIGPPRNASASLGLSPNMLQ